MGFIDTAPGSELPVFFNVVKAVGKNAPNRSDDVKLVQFLLIAFYEKVAASHRPKGDIAVTGFCGGATMNWILKFQIDTNFNANSPGLILMDNRVDRILSKNMVGSISKTIYTLASLNKSVAVFNPEKFLAVPSVVPLENPLNVPPPTRSQLPPPAPVPATGGV